ncbi:MAG TPA: GDP-mannose 4,6-dehydratase [Thermoanaerobaculia bacterium]|nr:GDP-mannose 4,6-dehydratase [Thermoanaerobaculia bacterium]
MKRALIFGISGQDGAYLAQLLLAKGYEVHGTSRDADLQSFARLDALGVRERVTAHSVSLRDFRELLQIVTAVRPDEIYNLAGQSSVALSFSQPIESMESIAQAELLLLEVIRYLKLPTRLYNAGSSECFGDQPRGSGADEATPFNPRSPYAAAKAAAHWTTVNYREAYGLFACSGILFNHESPLRSERYVTKKIVAAAAAIARGARTRLSLGTTAVVRDWGYAPEYVEAMWRMLQQEQPDDFVIATGESHTIADFAAAAFGHFGLDAAQHIDVDESLFRPSDISWSCGNPAKAERVLEWKAQTKFANLVKILCEAER